MVPLDLLEWRSRYLSIGNQNDQMGIDHYHTDPKDDDLDFCIEKDVERSTSGSLTIFYTFSPCLFSRL